MKGNFVGLHRNLKYIQCRYLNSLVPRDRISYNTINILPTERTVKRREWFASENKRLPKKSKCIDKNLNIHVSLENDPLKLANYIRRLLKNDRFHLAVQIVRNVSRSIQCVVSWNHLIDWLMSKGKMNAAFKIYHEMKKRANIPDAHTYTILFRGCTKSLHPKQALGNAIAVYQSMLLDRSPVKPNIIHMNAILKLCAISGDLEYMLHFVNELPSSGVRAATSATFTTVLNAIRYNAVSRLPTPPSDEQKKQRIQSMVLQAHQIWRDVIKRWRNEDMWIDEELVCSMGHILLTSEDKRHWREILAIIEQTMGIPRQFHSFDPNWKDLDDPKYQHQNESMLSQNLETHLTPGSDSSPELSAPKLKHYSPSVIPKTNKFARPGRNSLSLVLKATLLLSIKEPATEYWRIFTEQYNIQPDLENYVSYLRILRIFRASTETLKILTNMPSHFMVPQVFRIAISSSFRDKNNHHAFSNAGKILDLMQNSLEEPDVPTISRYLELAMLSPSKSKNKLSIVDTTISNGALGSQILRALDRVQQLILKIKSYIFFRDMGLELQPNRHEYLVNVEKLIRKSIQAHTLLLKQRLVPDNLFSELRARNNELCHLISRLSRYRKSVGGFSSKTYGPEP
ncbi:putative pentatricopeptide repeat protein [Erysiphe neolycopersici]|uniref:Putative pentatricopeptide repeat protein n=1 Tax=Erysiphe neolycopersici TaxID=212602 RepID=A0A420I2H9_9PEZI|nr:putative pentatricopeptide repeat protein [Erysiphe neolycopersici]